MAPFVKKRIAKTAILLVLVLTVLVPPVYRTIYESAPFRLADSAGTEYVDAAFNRALVAFALARTTNAIISVVQDSEIDIAPAGIGVTIAIGEALDPINDMIERFSWVMLVSLVSLGIQKLLIDISPWIGIKLFLLPALLLLTAGLWSEGGWAVQCRFYGVRLLFLALLVRFCIPLVALANDQVYNLFLDKHYTAAVSSIETGNVALGIMDPLSDERGGRESEGFWKDMRHKVEQASEAVDLQHRITRMKSRLSGMIENLLKMIAVFVLNTVLLPIGFLWLLARLFRVLTARDTLQSLEQVLLEKIAAPAITPPVERSSEAVHPARDEDQPEVDKKHEDVKGDQ